MRLNVVARSVAAMVLLGSLGACGLPGGEPGGAVLVITPNPGVFDLPSSGEPGRDTITFTVRNIGHAGTGDGIIWQLGELPPIVTDAQVTNADCFDGIPPATSCLLEVLVSGHAPPPFSYDLSLRVAGTESGDTTIPIFVI